MRAAVETSSVACNHCGANLDIAEDTRFVTCTYCDTKLQVRREGGALFTKVQKAVAKLEKRAAKIETKIDVLELEAELDRVDRDWERDRVPLMNRSKSGDVSVPSRTGAIASFAILAATGMVLALMMKSGEGALLGIATAIAGALLGLYLHSKAVAYERAHRAHLERREEIEDELRKARRKS